jgi:hypothetical protein
MDIPGAVDRSVLTAADDDTTGATVMPTGSAIIGSSSWEDTFDEDDLDATSPWSFSHDGGWVPQDTSYNDNDEIFAMHSISAAPVGQSTLDKPRAAESVLVSPSIIEAAKTLVERYYNPDSQPPIANPSVKRSSLTLSGSSSGTGSSGDTQSSGDASNESPPGGQTPDCEKAFTSLGYTMRDFIRSYLTYDEVPRSAILWAPPRSTRASTRPAPTPLQLPNETSGTRKLDFVCQDPSWSSTVSFRSFSNYILPGTTSLYVFLPPHISASFFTTGPTNSRGLMLWHSPKNTASVYEWGALYPTKRAGLEEGWTEVRGIISRPHMWERLEPYAGLEHINMAGFPFKQFPIGYLFCLPDVRDEHREILPLYLDVQCMYDEFSQPKVKPVLMRFNCENAIQLPEGWNTEKGKGIVGGLEVTRLTMGLGGEMRVITERDGVWEGWKISSFD